MAFDQQQYINGFIKENYDQISIRIPRGNKRKLLELSQKTGMPIKDLIVAAIEEKYKIDLTSKTK